MLGWGFPSVRQPACQFGSRKGCLRVGDVSLPSLLFCWDQGHGTGQAWDMQDVGG